jgi:hypothetical protein
MTPDLAAQSLLFLACLTSKGHAATDWVQIAPVNVEGR